jgi:hypothetical protein
LLVISALSLRFAAFSISWFVATPMCSSLFMVCCYANVLFSFHGLLLRQCALLFSWFVATPMCSSHSI